jgi:hypothetical protein
VGGKMLSETEKEMRRVLDAINHLSQKYPSFYIDDLDIAKDLLMSIQDVRDYMDLLERKDLIETANSQGGYSAKLNANGRIFLKDPNYFTENVEITPVNFSGNFQGTIINFQSELTHVNQTINSAPGLDDVVKAQIQDLIQQLFNELKGATSENEEKAEAVLETAKILVETVSREKSNKSLITISAEGLKKAAENIASVMPTVLLIANQIIALLK